MLRRPVIGDIFHKLSNREELDRYPARLRAKDGSIKVLIASNSRFQDGKFVSTSCFTTHVTDLHEAETARYQNARGLVETTDPENDDKPLFRRPGFDGIRTFTEMDDIIAAFLKQSREDQGRDN